MSCWEDALPDCDEDKKIPLHGMVVSRVPCLTGLEITVIGDRIIKRLQTGSVVPKVKGMLQQNPTYAYFKCRFLGPTQTH